MRMMEQIKELEKKIDRWDARYIKIAQEVAQWSKDPSTKVGSVISSRLRTKIISTGYNGFPRGFNDDPAGYENRDFKYPRVVHAEANAILNAACSLRNCVLYCTHPCCANCTGLLINAGITTVVWIKPDDIFLDRWADSMAITMDMLDQCGVRTRIVEA